MTWKEIKEEIEKLGVKDEDEVLYIDSHFPPMISLTVEKNKNGSYEIWS